MSNEILFGLKNRSAGAVVYNVPDLGVRREFQPGETKKVTKAEIEALANTPGGMDLINNYLIVEEPVREELGMEVEPEYDYTEKEIVELIKTGDMDHWEDMLNFAPSGVIDLVKALSVSVPLVDMNKAQLLKEKTGFDAITAIANERAVEQDSDAPSVSDGKPVRKTGKTPAASVSNKPARKATEKYTVISERDE